MGVPKTWLADLKTLVGAGSAVDPDKPIVGILAFEAAATMARLVCLYRSLAGPEVQKLRSETMRSKGVAYLNSTDQFFLLCVASAEFMMDLDRAAVAVARMGLKCKAFIPHGFDKLYNDIKTNGVSDAELERFGLGSNGKSVEKRMKRMEKYVAMTSLLYDELEVLNEIEVSSRDHSRRNSGPIPLQKPSAVVDNGAIVPAQMSDPVQVELRAQIQKVRKLKDESLWNKTYDKAVELMARAVVTVFARICGVFSQVPGLPDRNQKNNARLKGYPNFPGKHSSGPLERPVAKDSPILRNSAPIYVAKAAIANTLLGKWEKLLEAPPNTVGASGLAVRYANVIAMAEKLLAMKCGERDEEEDEFDEEEEAAVREELYGMMPVAMQGALRAKLRECWRKEGSKMDGGLAEGWREAVERILTWLSPVARDTLRWQEERNMDRRQRFETRPRALLLQTLHFSDAEKTAAAIVEVLVGLSCMSWYDERRRRGSSVGSVRFDGLE